MTFIDREPIVKKAVDSVRDRFHRRRTSVDDVIERNTLQFENRNIGGGTAIGAASAAIAVVIEDTVGIPFGASSDIVGSRSVEGGTEYTVNVNAPFRNMAEARATIDSSTGFTSFLTDRIDIENVEIQRTRVFRDTYQIDVLVEE